MKLNFTWKRQTGEYQQGEDLYLNRLYLASCSWNSMHSRDDDDTTRYVGNITLPSLNDKLKLVYGSSAEELKPQIEQIITRWFTEALKGSE